MYFIGIGLNKRIFTACVLNDDEKIVEELVDIETDEKGLDFLMSRLSYGRLQDRLREPRLCAIRVPLSVRPRLRRERDP